MARRNQQALDFRVTPLLTLLMILAPWEISPKRLKATINITIA